MSVKANVRSPYFLKYSDTNLTRVSLDLYVYSGTKTVDKGDVVYNLDNDVIEGNDFVVFEVSEFVKDYIEHSFNGVYSTTPYWFTAEATLYNEDAVIRTETVDRLAFDGYTKFDDGINYEGNRDELITSRTIRIPEGQVYKLPIFAEDIVSVTQYTFFDGTVVTAGANWDEENREWNIVEDYWDDSTSENVSVVSEIVDSSTSKVQYFTVESTVDRITVASSGNSYDIINTEQMCSKYGWNKLTFINKHGALQDFYCTGKKTEKVGFDSDTFKSNNIDFSSMSYNTDSGQINRFKVSSSKEMTLNSGYIHEDEMSALEELIMSENVWLTDEDGNICKVIPTDRVLDIKKHVNDKLINVQINLEVANDNLNTVI